MRSSHEPIQSSIFSHAQVAHSALHVHVHAECNQAQTSLGEHVVDFDVGMANHRELDPTLPTAPRPTSEPKYPTAVRFLFSPGSRWQTKALPDLDLRMRFPNHSISQREY